MNSILYLFFIICFVFFVLFTIYDKKIEANTGYDREYTSYHWTWDKLDGLIQEYKNILNDMQTFYPIIWNVGKINESSMITNPTLTLSGNLPNVYINITFPSPLPGPKGPIGEQGPVGVIGDDGLPGPMGERGYACFPFTH